MNNKRILALLLLAMAVSAVAACGETTATTTTHAEDEFSFGSPAEAAQADRVIEIVANDQLRFEPADVTVDAGETITFRIVNMGNLVHDFTLGTEATQAEHEEEMSGMEGMDHGDPNVALVQPGETVELTWRFGDAGQVLYGCHQPGHYAAGMRGIVQVRG